MQPKLGALAGVRVIEIGATAVAYAGKLLADMGAEVIKVEESPTVPAGTAALRRFYDTSKRSIVLDPRAESDQETLRRLLARADVVLRDRGIEATTTRALAGAAQVVDVLITPFGRSGPWAGYRGSDLICQAAGGMVYPNGSPQRAPLQVVGLQAYHAAGSQAAMASVLALLERSRSGRGQTVDISIQESVAASVEHASSLFFAHHRVARRQGTLHWTGRFRQARCRDGFILLSTLGDWTTLVEWAEAEGALGDLGDARWQSEDERRAHGAHLLDLLEPWAARHDATELAAGAQLRRLPFAVVAPIASLARNPQLHARQFFVSVQDTEEDGGRGTTRLHPGAPYRLSGTPWRLGGAAPAPGAHGDEIRRQLLGTAAPAAETPQRAPRRAPLAGIRVVDFTWVVAGPAATRVLADHGAEVIKVEPLGAPADDRRRGLFANLNRGKRSLALDLRDERGRRIAERLIATADVVVDNFSARVMPELGLDYERLRRIKADIITVRMTGFGTTGPWRDHVSYGPTLQAISGYTHAMRHPGDPPTGLGFSYADMAAGNLAALATLIALYHRQRTGEGQQIDVAQLECLASLLGPHLVHRAGAGTGPPDLVIDNVSQEVPTAPHGVYRCADHESLQRDRWCAIAVFGDDDWRRFVSALGHPAWAADPCFHGSEGRTAHRVALDERVESWTRPRHAEWVMHHLQAHGIAAAVVADALDLCELDPQLRSRGFWCTVPAGGSATTHVDGSAARLTATPPDIRAAAPLLGEHGEEVLTELLGIPPGELVVLRQHNLVA